MRRRHYKRKARRLMCDVNVTPLIDVMLVLLVIFMVTAPMLHMGVNVDLPKTTSQVISQVEKTIVVTVDKVGHVFVGDVHVSMDHLPAKITALSHGKIEQMKIFIKGDARVDYSYVADVLGVLTKAGCRKLVLLTEDRSSDKVVRNA